MASPIFPDFTPDPAASPSLSVLSEGFNSNVTTLNQQMQKALQEVQLQPTNPAALSAYQARASDYTIFRELQATVIKIFRSLCESIIRAFQ